MVWQAYHLDAANGLPIITDLVLEVDLLGEETATQKASVLFFLSRESLKRRQISELWQRTKATSPTSLAKALLSPAVLEAIRKEVRRQTKQNVEVKEILDQLSRSVLRPEITE